MKLYYESSLIWHDVGFLDRWIYKAMSTKDTTNRPYSSQIVDGLEQAPSRAMLRAVGFTEEDFGRSQIGIASTWSMVTPCNMHINELARHASEGANAAGGKAVGRRESS